MLIRRESQKNKSGENSSNSSFKTESDLMDSSDEETKDVVVFDDTTLDKKV